MVDCLLAVGAGDAGGACEGCIGQPDSTRARPNAEAMRRHEKKDWFRGMAVPFSRLYCFSVNVRSLFTHFTPGDLPVKFLSDLSLSV